MNKIKIDGGVRLILALLLVGQLFFPNGIYMFAAVVCLYIGIYYLQKPYKPAVFTMIFFYHFLQIFAGICLAIYLGKDINYRSENMGFATALSLIGLIIMFVPIFYYQNKIPDINIAILKKHADKLSINKTFYVYIIAFFLSGSLNAVRFLLEGYTQIIISVVYLKWFLFLLFGFQCVLKNRRKGEFYFFIALEFIMGFYSFFSDFKTVLFFVAALYISLINRMTIQKFITGAVIGIFVFFGGTIWTTVKVEYRSFLNKGAVSQNVSVSQNEALSKLYEITNSQEKKATSSATEKFLDRLQATYNFSKAIDRVPAILPYQNGRNWTETFEFIFTPRLLNPNKPQLDASKKASKYTGLNYAGIAQGTSFSLGYFADCYIDFGPYGMMIILFLIGCLFGITYYYYLRNLSKNFIFNYSLVCALYMRYFALEMDNTFFIGSLITDLLTYFLLSKFFFPWLYKTLLVSKNNRNE